MFASPALRTIIAALCATAISACSFSLTSSGAGPNDTLAERGQALVEARCAKCHAIAATGNSPYPGAQPFRLLWERWTRPALRDGLQTGITAQHDHSEVHLPVMKLNDGEIDALFAYLDTLPPPDARRR